MAVVVGGAGVVQARALRAHTRFCVAGGTTGATRAARRNRTAMLGCAFVVTVAGVIEFLVRHTIVAGAEVAFLAHFGVAVARLTRPYHLGLLANPVACTQLRDAREAE